MKILFVTESCPQKKSLPTHKIVGPPLQFTKSPRGPREIFINQQEITTLTVIWARQLVSPQPKLGPVP